MIGTPFDPVGLPDNVDAVRPFDTAEHMPSPSSRRPAFPPQ